MKIGSEIDESILEGSNELEDYQRISVLPETEHQEEIDMSDGPSISETYGCLIQGQHVKTLKFNIMISMT